MLKGEAVQNFTMMFLQMWNVSERGKEDYAKYLTPKSLDIRRELGFVLPYADSHLIMKILESRCTFIC